MTQQILMANEQADALLIFAHGAGADMNHEYIENVASSVLQLNLSVVRFNFPYMEKRQQDGKRRPPDRMPKLVSCYRDVIEKLDTDLPIFIGGKSMGGRVAATIAEDHQFLSEYNIKGIICWGYPFHPAKKPESLRLEPLQNTKVPVLVLQGDRDALGSKGEIENYTLSPACQVNYFADGDHDLKPRVKSGYTLLQHQNEAIKKIREFIDEII